MTDIFFIRRGRFGDNRRQKDHMKTEAEMEGSSYKVRTTKDCQQPPDTGRWQERILHSSLHRDFGRLASSTVRE